MLVHINKIGKALAKSQDMHYIKDSKHFIVNHWRRRKFRWKAHPLKNHGEEATGIPTVEEALEDYPKMVDQLKTEEELKK